MSWCCLCLGKKNYEHVCFVLKYQNFILVFFIAVEDSNFALFNFVNEQNNEIERLRDKIEEVRKRHLILLCPSAIEISLTIFYAL